MSVEYTHENKHPRIAVIYTGEPRTIKTTIGHFVKNVLTNENVHVFSILQTDNREEVSQLLLEKMGKHIKYINWFTKEDFSWNLLKNSILQNMQIEDRWKHYLSNSGSMIEYYQLYLAQNELTNYEGREGIKYDYILRIRPDTVITRPANFNFLNMNDDIILQRLRLIAEKMGEHVLHSKKILTYFMNSLIDDKRLDFINYDHTYENDKFTCSLLENNWDEFSILVNQCNSNNRKPNEETIVKLLKNFIKNGNYVLTFRMNVIYFMNRKHFYNISQLGLRYGKYNLTKGDYYWFNAECQFQSACIQNGLHFFNTHTEFEGRSICSYEPDKYYDQNGDLLNGTAFFFLKRS
jgi:hypothetical protein